MRLKKDIWYECGCFLFIVFIAVIIMMMSPLNPFYEDVAGGDSSVFKYVALVMSKGGMPYKDAFDHKGPLIYILNYFGMLLSYYRGIWIIETLFMISTLLVLYEIARLLCNRLASIVVVLASCSCLSTYFEGGNLTEEYSMFFIAVGIYIFLDYFINNEISRARLVICGLCFGAVALLRINMVAVWVVFSLAVLVQSLRKKDNRWIFFLIYFLIGVSVITIPIFIWLIMNGAFGDFFTDYIVFNLKYASDSERASIVNRYSSITYFGGNSLLLGALMILLFFIRKKDDLFVNVTYLCGIFLSLIVMSVSGMSYPHYGMMMIPLLVYPYAKFFSINFDKDNIYRWFLGCFLVIVTFNSWQDIGKTAVTKYYNYSIGNTGSSSGESEKIVNLIMENTKEDDEIMVLGNDDIWYVLSKRLSVSKYSYQTPIANIDDNILNAVIEGMENNEPILVIMENGCEYLFPNVQDYELIYSDKNRMLYVLNIE